MNSEDQRNLILAIVLSALVLIGWNYFYAPKPPEKPVPAPIAQPFNPNAANPANPLQPGLGGESAAKSRPEVIAASARVAIDTPSLGGSIALTGGLIDDIILKGYQETIDPKSPNITLFSPPGSPDPYWAESGFVSDDKAAKTPNRSTVWSADATTLGVGRPVTLTWDNGAGLKFMRRISVDDRYMFTIADSVENTGTEPVSLRPYALILRRGKPNVAGYAVLHEGFVGVIGDGSVQEITYGGIEKEPGKVRDIKGDGGWLGFTDKYWASAIIPAQSEPIEARFSASGPVTREDYQSDFVGPATTVAPGAEAAEQFAAALRIDPGDFQARLNYGLALFHLGRVEDALGQYQSLVPPTPDSADLHFDLGLALDASGRPGEAIAQYRRALEIAPANAEARNNLGAALFRAGRFAEAIAEYREAVRLQPEAARAHYNLGMALAQAGPLEEAIAEYRSALRIEPGSAEAHNNLGGALARAGRPGEAIAEFEQALRIRPEYARARANLEQLQTARGGP